MSKEERYPPYVEKAVEEFRRIMRQKMKNNASEEINRENKGELFVLHYLSDKGDDASPSELSSALHSSPARISALLKSLEKKGKIERHIDANNRRNVRVLITKTGDVEAEAEIQKFSDIFAKIFIEMGEKDSAEYLRLLERFHELSHQFFQESKLSGK